MMDLEQFSRVADLLIRRGFDADRAYRLAAEIGDTPVFDGADLVVTEKGVEVDRFRPPEDLFG